MLGYKRFLEELLDHRNGLKVHSIHFVKVALLDKKTQEQLEGVGLGNSEPVYFSIKGKNYCEGGVLNTNSNLRGCAINIKTDGLPEQVILIQKDFSREASLSAEIQEDWECMLKLTALAHELGHVEDMQLKTNSNFVYGGNPTVDLVEAEAYAHAYCLNYLHDVDAYTARNTLATALYRMNTSKKRFEKGLYLSVCNKVGKGRIKKWSNP